LNTDMCKFKSFSRKWESCVVEQK